MSPAPLSRSQPTVVLAVSGSIAAYKAPMIARLLLARGVRVLPLMTRAAREFLGPSTLSGLTGEPVQETMWDPSLPGEAHVALARQADLVLVSPATADLLSRLAQGRADCLLTALALCARCPLLLAPAMHPRMWEHPATQRNVRTLREDGRARLVGPVFGEVASGEQGLGRMAEPEAIVEAAMAELGALGLLPDRAPAPSGDLRDLEGLHLLVTAGPTVEDLDPVRFLSNRSTGKMGYAVAERAALRGARVTLVSGPVSLPTPHGVRRVDVRSALELQAALLGQLGPELAGADALVMTAAVGDYRVAKVSPTKLKRSGEALSLELLPNPDVLAELGARRSGPRPFLVGFAVETARGEELVGLARGKLRSKKVDLVVANHAGDAFGREDNRVVLVGETEAEELPQLSKFEVADRLLDVVSRRVVR